MPIQKFADTDISADEAGRILIRIGFTKRSGKGDHSVYQRGGKSFTLSNGSKVHKGTWEAIRKLEESYNNRIAQGKRRRKKEEIPSQVSIHGVNWAVKGVIDNIFYEVLSLEDGHIEKVHKKETRPAIYPILQGVTVMTNDEETEVPTPVVIASSNNISTTSMQDWLLMTRRLIQSLDIQIEQIEIKIKPLRKQRDELINALRLIGGETVAATLAPLAIKPESKPRKATTAAIPQQTIDLIRMAYADLNRPTGYGWVPKVRNKVIEMGGPDVNPQAIRYYTVGRG